MSTLEGKHVQMVKALKNLMMKHDCFVAKEQTAYVYKYCNLKWRIVSTGFNSVTLTINDKAYRNKKIALHDRDQELLQVATEQDKSRKVVEDKEILDYVLHSIVNE